MRLAALRVVGLVGVIGLGLAAPGRAERPPLKAYTTADGLAHDSVNKIVRDSRGFLWFCTAEGLSRFDGSRFKNYTQDQGLPHRNINDLLETRAGDYLVATSAGVSVFNPRGTAYRWNVLESRLEQTSADQPLFRTFLPPAAGSPTNTVILSLAEDGHGRIWAGTADGLFRLERAGDSWTFREVAIQGFKNPPNEITGLITDASGDLLVGCAKGLFRIASNGRLTRLFDQSSTSIYRDRDNRLWVDVGTELCLFAWDRDALTLVHRYSQRDGLPPHALHFYTLQLSDGRIYVGFEYGISEFLPEAKGDEPKFRVFEREKVNALAEDAGGALWIGTDTKGAWKLAPTGFMMFGDGDGLPPTDELMSVFPDRDDGVYVASRPNTLSHLAARPMGPARFERVTPRGLTNRSWGWHFLDLLSRDDEWWVPGADGLRHYPKVARFADLARTSPSHVYTRRDGLSGNEVFLQFEDSRGDIWFALIAVADTLVRWERRTGRIFQYTTADGLPRFNGPMSFAEDSHGNVWFGYYFGGLARYRDGKFRLFTDRDGLPASRVNDLLADSSGRLWIATSGRGLFRVDRPDDETLVFRGLSTADGLSSNLPQCLTEDRLGRVYVGTGLGINRIDRDGTLRIFTEEDGLPGDHITRCAADRTGRLWFITRNTLVRFTPAAEPTAPPPDVFIDKVLVNGVPQHVSDLGERDIQPLDLASNQRQIQVDYLALTFTTGTNIRYQYQLDAGSWSAPTRERTVSLDLAPGSHTLQVRAINAAGTLGAHQASVRLHILAPVWLRWWFIGSIASLGALVLWAFYGYRVARLREINAALAGARRAEEALRRSREERLGELERVRARIATDLHDDIGSSLTQIAVLSEVARRAEDGGSQPIERIISISNELVDTMSDIVWAINPRKDHLSDLLQRMRRFASDVLSASHIAFTFRTPDADRDVELGANVRREVFLIFKETLNNIVRHSACTRVDISFSLDDDRLVLRVSDDGKGFDPEAVSDGRGGNGRGGNGLVNMRRRSREIGAKLEMISRPGAGTTTILHLFPTHTGGAGRAHDEGS
jgi:signal transduction histidine kinase/ligand-binding sensor domain-containing protein